MPTPEEEAIIARFRAEMWNGYTEPRRHRPLSYSASWYAQMLDTVNGYGPEGTAIYLIDQNTNPFGLNRLERIGLLKCSAEAIILRPEYRIPDLPSTPERREKARQRLRNKFSYTAPWDDGK